MAMQPELHKHIKSFVRRTGHITSGQKSAREKLLAQWSAPFRPEPLDFQALFGRTGPVLLEIGFGMGEATAALAASRPDWNLLGIEVYPAGIGALLGKIEQQSLENIRLIEYDAVDVLHHMIADSSLDAVHIFFPDPWPKKRHHKRRLIQPHFVQLLCTKIKSGGYLHLATDWPDYAVQMLSVLNAEPRLSNLAGQGFAERPSWRPLTKFEQRGIRLGFPPADLVYAKR
jgi:tRNA (guanine-N7-)-methyltransferase